MRSRSRVTRRHLEAMIVRHRPWCGRRVPRVRLALRLERLLIESSLGHAPLLGGDLLHQRGELLLLLLLGGLDALEGGRGARFVLLLRGHRRKRPI